MGGTGGPYGAVAGRRVTGALSVIEGVVRTSGNDLVFYVNGVSQSAAASDLPPQVWAVVDMGDPWGRRGRCAEASRTGRSMILIGLRGSEWKVARIASHNVL